MLNNPSHPELNMRYMPEPEKEEDLDPSALHQDRDLLGAKTSAAEGDLGLPRQLFFEFLRRAETPESEKHGTIAAINRFARPFHFYDSSPQYPLPFGSNLPFQISPSPFRLPDGLRVDLAPYGRALVNFYHAADALYRAMPKDHRWRRYLDCGKPPDVMEGMGSEAAVNHLFLRPDFILTEEGITVTEIETSPFGLPLACFLNSAYRSAGEPTLTDHDVFLDRFVQEVMGTSPESKVLCFVLSHHTNRYRGQFEYLKTVLEQRGMRVLIIRGDHAELNEQADLFGLKGPEHVFYRAFYLHETVGNAALQRFVNTHAGLLPSPKVHLEEKAILGLLFEPELETWLRQRLGQDFDILRRIIPPTFVVDKDAGVPASFPADVSTWQEFARLPRAKRRFVLKISGFHEKASWGKGVTFLDTLSREKCADVLEAAQHSGTPFVIQSFHKGKKFPWEYFDFDRRDFRTATGRVRLTPYFAVRDGSLLLAKATLRENTDYVHASTDSINGPVI